MSLAQTAARFQRDYELYVENDGVLSRISNPQLTTVTDRNWGLCIRVVGVEGERLWRRGPNDDIFMVMQSYGYGDMKIPQAVATNTGRTMAGRYWPPLMFSQIEGSLWENPVIAILVDPGVVYHSYGNLDPDMLGNVWGTAAGSRNTVGRAYDEVLARVDEVHATYEDNVPQMASNVADTRERAIQIATHTDRWSDDTSGWAHRRLSIRSPVNNVTHAHSMAPYASRVDLSDADGVRQRATYPEFWPGVTGTGVVLIPSPFITPMFAADGAFEDEGGEGVEEPGSGSGLLLAGLGALGVFLATR